MINSNMVIPPKTPQHQCCGHGCCCCHNPVTQTAPKPLERDTFVSGILPPKDWKPDPYVGLGPELSPEEKLKKKYEDLRKPMYFEKPSEQVEDKPQKKTFKEKVHDFVHRINEKIKNLSQNILCSVKNIFNKTQKN